MEVRVERREFVTRVVAEFTDADLLRVHLDKFDLVMLKEPVGNAADILLDAELIARRLCEQAASPSPETAP